MYEATDYKQPIPDFDRLPAHELPPPPDRKANATLLMLARNSDVDSAVRSVRELEDKFNRRYQYPWVFLNEEEFSNDFKK